MTGQRSESRLKKAIPKISNNKSPSTKGLYNCTTKYAFLTRCLHFSLKTKNQSRVKQRRFRMLTTTMKNWNKTRRDHDIIMANAMNNKLPAKINGWSDTGDGLPYHINSLLWNSCSRRNESSLSYGWRYDDDNEVNRVRTENRIGKKRCDPIKCLRRWRWRNRGAIRRVVSIKINN